MSRLLSDGSWRLYPNRQTAVTIEYEAIKETVGSSQLWTAAGNEIWVDFDVYNGVSWERREPEGVHNQSPKIVASDGKNRIWALTVTAANAPFGETPVTFTGTSGAISHQNSFTLAVVEQAVDSMLPMVTR